MAGTKGLAHTQPCWPLAVAVGPSLWSTSAQLVHSLPQELGWGGLGQLTDSETHPPSSLVCSFLQLLHRQGDRGFV